MIIMSSPVKNTIILIMLTAVAVGLDNGLGKTPPMGWNSWNHYGCKIN